MNGMKNNHICNVNTIQPAESGHDETLTQNWMSVVSKQY